MALEYLLRNHYTVATVTLGLIAMVAAIVLPSVVKFIRMFRYFQTLPGIPEYSILFGNLHMIPQTGEDRFVYVRHLMDDLNPKYIRVWWGPFRVNVGVYHQDTVKLILRSTAPKSRGFGHTYEHIIPWIGEGLITSNGDKWARSRKLLTPAFHLDILKPHVQVSNKAVDVCFEKLDQFADSGESFNVCPPLILCALDVILRCAMSYETDVQRQGHPYSKAVRELLDTWNKRTGTPWMWFDFIFRLTPAGRRFYQNCEYVHKVADELISQRKLMLEREGLPKVRHLDFLDILLTARDEDGRPMSVLEIRNEVDTFLFAGHDTTAACVCWILYALAKYREYQVKVQAELDAVLKNRDSDHIEWSDLAKLHTMQICIKEAMRLYPPVPHIQRILNEPIEIEGKRIPPGTMITLSIVNLHINPLTWDAPDEFRPERFLPENIKDADTFSFVPFSAGSRNCIGQNFALNEVKVMIGRILHRYNVEIASDAPAIERSNTAILTSISGIWIRLKRRQV